MLPREEDRPKNTNNEYSNSNTGNGVTVVATPTIGPTGIWEGRQMVFEQARVANIQRCDRYLKFFENARCDVVEEITSDHDATISDAQFVSHSVGRLLDQDLLTPTPIMSKEYKDLSKISEMATAGSFDRFYGMYKYNTIRVPMSTSRNYEKTWHRWNVHWQRGGRISLHEKN